MSSEKERPDRVRVGGSPVHCPYCKGELEDLKSLVACAACGARHHEECHTANGRCATCGAREKLVPPESAPRALDLPRTLEPPRVLDPPPGSRIQVIRQGDSTVLTWPSNMKQGRDLLLLFLILMCFPLGLVVWYLWRDRKERPARLELSPRGIDVDLQGLLGDTRFTLSRAEVGRVGVQTSEHGTTLFIDHGLARRPIAAALAAPELDWLADRITAWKREGV